MHTIQSPASGAQPQLGLRDRGRLVLVDRDPLARRAMREGLELTGSFEVVAEAADLEQATLAVAIESPDLVLIDVGYPQLDGIAIAEALASVEQAPPLVICAVVEDGGTAVRCLAAGAVGFLDKGIDPTALSRALRGVLDGEAAISRRLGRLLIEELRAPAAARSARVSSTAQLTPREWQVLELIVDGASTSEMADGLGLARETVRSHVKHVLRKLAVGSRGEAADIAGGLRAPSRTPLAPR